jgi:hypothetical protein
MTFPTIAELEADLATHYRRRAEADQSRWDSCLDEAPGSSTLDSSIQSEIIARLALAREGYRVGFVGLCRLDGSPAKGQWYESKWRSRGSSWGTPKPDGSRGLAFISGELIYASRGVGPGAVKANEKLAAMGFRWEGRRLRAWAETRYPDGMGTIGIFYASLRTFPADADGNPMCRDSLVYPAREFFCTGQGDLTADEEFAVYECLNPT